MHPILQRLKESSAAATRRSDMAAALSRLPEPTARLVAWRELRHDLAAALSTLGAEERDALVELLASPEPPARFERNVDIFVFALRLPGHAPVQLLLHRDKGRWRPVMPDRRLCWQLGGSLYADLGAALVQAERDYATDPDFYEALLKHGGLEEEGAALELDPGKPALSQAVEVLAGAGGLREVSPWSSLPPPDAPHTADQLGAVPEAIPYEGGAEIDPGRPSKRKKGGQS